MYCAPGVNKGVNGCFDQSALIRIIDAYNYRYPELIIKYDPNMAGIDLWDLVRNGLKDVCGNDEWCWLDQDFLEQKWDIQGYYKPRKPETKTKWLSTSDINHVLKQFEKTHNDFAFMGTVPIDFDQIIDEYAKMDFCALYNGRGMNINGDSLYVGKKIRRFGFVFNLDPHNKKGSHWVSMFMDFTRNNPYVGYFDSYGHCPPPEQVVTLMDRLKNQVKGCLGIDLIKKCNTIRHQHKNTECGVYSLYYIYNSLLGKTFEEISENIILDDDVNQYRDFFFRPTIFFKEKKK